ncbi:DEAD/DEAH box helicase [Vulcanisaeta thermophila]|uniref:DEAD/DEAH box helicase n=1 Tax=Vulcanisaeta thermophila TaxID=867917 RepID=UPI00085386D4|nr:DEAD/DEAH box helicase [Vulcanisaeta thermophila]
MLFRVVINDVEIRRNWDWGRISKVKEDLKRLGFRWNGEYWSGRALSPVVVKELKDLLELTEDEVDRIMRSIVVNSEGGAVGIENPNLPEEFRECVLSEFGGVGIVSIPCMVRVFVRNDKEFIGKSTSYEDYVDKALEFVRKLIGNAYVIGNLEQALSRAKEFALANSKLRGIYDRRVQWWTARLDTSSVTLNFLSRRLMDGVRNLVVPYYYVDREGNLNKRDLRLIRRDDIVREGGKVIIRFPPFLRDRIKELLISSGYRVEEVPYNPRYITIPRDDIKLLPFQEKALSNWLNSGMRGTIVIPTGGGKTFIALKALAVVKVRTLVLVVTEELMNQWWERLMRYLGIRAGRLGGGFDDVREVTVAIYNSAVNRIESIAGGFDFVIFDEAHHVPADTFKEVAFRLTAPFRMALSATPKRSDSNEHLIFMSAGDIVYQADYRDMVNSGLVVPVRHFRVYVDLSLDEKLNYEKAERTNNPIIMRNIASKASAKVNVAVEIVKMEVRLGSKVLVFTQFIDQAEEIYNKLKDELGPIVALITSKVSDRDSIFRAFAKGSIKVLVTTTVLDEGIDVPDADVAVVVSGTGSERQMIQRVGRVVRRSEGKVEARVYEIVTRNTIEQALSEERHVKGEVEEVECKSYLANQLGRLLNHVMSSTSLFK